MDLEIPYLNGNSVAMVMLIEKAGIPVYEDVGRCSDPNIAGYTMGDPMEMHEHDIMVVLCINNIEQTWVNVTRTTMEVNKTVTHEALHVAQFCAGAGEPTVITPGFIDWEVEALAYENRPMAVAEQVIKHCF